MEPDFVQHPPEIAQAANRVGRAFRKDVHIGKDARQFRLLPFRPFALPVAYVPMTLEMDRPETFDAWLTGLLTSARR